MRWILPLLFALSRSASTRVSQAIVAWFFFSCGIWAQQQNQIVGAGYSYGAGLQRVAPGQVVTLVTTPLNVPDATATQTPLPTSLSGVSVTARVVGSTSSAGYAALLPILNVYTLSFREMPDGAPCSGSPNILCSSTQISVEIPTEGVCAPSLVGEPESCTAPPFYDLPPLLVLNVKANGVTGPDLPLQVAHSAAQPLYSCDPVFGLRTGGCYALVTHADGNFVTVDDRNPAHVGEIITLYAVGLGLDAPNNPPTGAAPSAPIQMFVPLGVGTVSFAAVVFGYSYPVPGGTTPSGLVVAASATSQTIVNPDWAGLIPGYVGLYQVNVTVPPAPSQSFQACGSSGNTTLAFLGQAGGTASICVQP
jgi:hypothetical protein